MSASGHIDYGDSPVDTAIREAKEEIDLDLTEEDLEFLGTLIVEDDQEREYPFLYRYDLPEDTILRANPEEVAEIVLVSLENLSEMLERETFTSNSRKIISEIILK